MARIAICNSTIIAIIILVRILFAVIHSFAEPSMFIRRFAMNKMNPLFISNADYFTVCAFFFASHTQSFSMHFIIVYGCLQISAVAVAAAAVATIAICCRYYAFRIVGRSATENNKRTHSSRWLPLSSSWVGSFEQRAWKRIALTLLSV